MTIPDGHLPTREAMLAYGVGRTKFCRVMKAAGIIPTEHPGHVGGNFYTWPMKDVMAVRAKEAGLRAARRSEPSRLHQRARHQRIIHEIVKRELTNAASPVTIGR